MNERYQAMLDEVKTLMAGKEGATSLDTRFPFRDRFEHTRRVVRWAERLLETDGREADADAVLTAAIWHDAGYALPGEAPHALRSADLFRDCGPKYGLSPERVRLIAGLIAEHSDKKRLLTGGLSPELTLLMEADELDETGAMCALWDALADGASEPSYRRACERIATHAERFAGAERHYVTPEAQRLFREKRALLDELVRQLRRDLEPFA